MRRNLSSKQVYTSPTLTYDTFLEYHKIYIQLSYLLGVTRQGLSIYSYILLETSGQVLPIYIGRVNKLMTNIIRSTYNCHTFLESSGQVHQTIYRVNIWGSMTLYPNIGLIWCRVKKLIFSIIVSRFCFIKVKVRSSKPLVIKLIVEVKVVPNLNRA